MNVAKHFAAASFVVAFIATPAAFAEPPLAAIGTLTIPAPFGSSPVLAWSWGASNSGSEHIGGGGGAGKANIQDLSLTRHADGQSPLFFDAVAKGQHLPTVVLVDDSVTITLTEVLVSSYSTGDAVAKDVKQTSPTENITFNFAKIAYTVNGVTKCFNIATNTSC
jgi:type VI secretion system secreted protein Hcp